MFRFFANKKLARGGKTLLGGSAIFFVSLALVATGYLIYRQLYVDKFFNGITLAHTNLTGKTIAEARREISAKIDAFSREGITVVYQNKKVNIPAAVIAPNPDVSFDLFSLHPEETLQALFKSSRGSNALTNLKEQISTLIFAPDNPLAYYADDQRLLTILKDNFGTLENKAQNADIAIKGDEITVSQEKYGKIFAYVEIIAQIKRQLAWLENQPVEIILQTEYPEIYAGQIGAPLLEQAKKILALAPVTLTASSTNIAAKQKEWVITPARWADFLTVKKAPGVGLMIGIQLDKLEKYLIEEITPAVAVKPADAKFQVTNGRVTEFQASRDGQAVNAPATLEILESALAQSLASARPLPILAVAIDKVPSAITNENVNDLGIKEIVGTGESDFSGSPANRRHNIAVGAASLNGTLIKPQEEFSVIKTLGEVNAKTGYLPEMVIKGDKTIPEYGGGLCQIGTTAFRAALASGLPVTERREHSYRVVYYEPAGTDATIYGPAPDLKFINDTEHYLLIQSRIEGNILSFDLWGTRDGRIVEQTKPKIYNIVAPPPTKTIETDQLKPGEKKCTERAHSGANAIFSYKVTYENGAVKAQDFASHYRPWQAICLVGVTASSTPETIVTPEATENNVLPAN